MTGDWNSDSGPETPKRKGGLRKIGEFTPEMRCTSPEHDPPSMIYLTPGEYEYTCPRCGRTITFTVQGHTLSV